MKRIALISLLVFIGLLYFTSCNKEKEDIFNDMQNKKIAIIENGIPTIVVNENDLLTRYNKLSKDNWNGTMFTDLEVKVYRTSKKDVYVLCAFNENHTEKISTLLEKNNGDISFKMMPYYHGTLSCHTDECSNTAGCTPVDENGSWHCSSCSGKCTKTTTIQL